ncbi:MAG TPA: tetrathionate reductase family octaheme c-type cytochrome [Prolixibacteraceae bacterium]|nr:tetrathionate reductase family octaheme c-type cytochrome [Prolixibacteraceae bacterium]HOS00069.1 tetrathionate reductase family octaheme c-type cytochrome [Prolixibacteraceae bacterium]HOS91512.1 tetrathionate reductase family octaheme c-type cytochrome [Prolixibacteraceae bacterium]HPL45459.1 tetrathionate reductase family octaheme c-type cytochrome [Prolixibacteraceae bacterium]HQE51778.1 tetrathionate reductase family octaheme c-type cytochrome [Prolixibacteraceae bacterium]
MKKTIIGVIVFVIAVLAFIRWFSGEEEYYNLKLEKLKQEYSVTPVSSIDHSKLSELQKKFASPQEVTEACNSCHTERHREVMNSAHWNWERVSYVEGRGIAAAGKKNVLNNFCLGAQSNELACAACHIGFGMTDDHFDFNNARNVDCMVCHDNSEEYMKGASMSGYPDRNVNLTKVAQSVGNPERINCGSCHFYSGGGNNVKHGDLEEAQLSCDRDLDVHMASNGMNMSCVACHNAENHQIKGKLYSVSSENYNRATCEDCHTGTPHFDDLLNRHNAKVSCQACHIPLYAKANATKMDWKWSDAGKLRNGEPYREFNSDSTSEYLSIKGTFRWAKNLKPDYIWFNGTADHYMLGDTIREVPVKMNTLFGSHDNKDSKIFPVKINTGDQIYDKVYKTLIQPKLFSLNKGDSAYWKDFNWNTAAAAGMARVGLPFSGQYDFVETIMYWPVNHMVAPKEKTVGCAECHTRSNGRLENLAGFYLPGRDHNRPLDIFGIFIIVTCLGGVFVHALFRILATSRRKKSSIDTITEP